MQTWLASILVCVADHSCGILKDFLIDVDWINPLSVDYELLARNPIKTPQNVLRLTLRATRMTIVPCPLQLSVCLELYFQWLKYKPNNNVVLILSSYNLIMIRCLTGIYFNMHVYHSERNTKLKKKPRKITKNNTIFCIRALYIRNEVIEDVFCKPWWKGQKVQILPYREKSSVCSQTSFKRNFSLFLNFLLNVF